MRLRHTVLRQLALLFIQWMTLMHPLWTMVTNRSTQVHGLGTEKEPKTGKLGSFWLHFSTLWAPLGSIWSHYGSIWSHLTTKNKWTEGGALRPLISFSKMSVLRSISEPSGSHLGAT